MRSDRRLLDLTKEVTLSLVSAMLDMDVQTREDLVYGSLEFMESQLAEVEGRLPQADRDSKLSVLTPSERQTRAREYALLESTYKSVFEKREELRTIQALEAKQKGAYLAVIDPPNEGSVVGPNRWGIAAFGAAVGLALGGTAIFGLNRRQRRQLAWRTFPRKTGLRRLLGRRLKHSCVNS